MKKYLVYLYVLAMCTVVLAEEKKTVESEKEKPDYRSVIVDTWLVKIDAERLYQPGVKPLSEKEKENVTVMNLLWCLSEPNSGEIMASARTQSSLKNTAECKSVKTEYVKQESGGGITFMPYLSAINFKSYSRILDDKKIKIEFSIQSNDFNISESNAPPEEIKIVFSDIVILSDKKSIIAGQSQIGSDMFFLVMRAEIVE